MTVHIAKTWLAAFLRTRVGMVLFCAVFWGSAMVAITWHQFPAMYAFPLPGLIPVAAILLVGACFGEAMWQWTPALHEMSRAATPVQSRRLTESLIASQLRAALVFRVLAGLLCTCCVLVAGLAVAMAISGTRPASGGFWILPVVVGMGWFSGLVAFRGRVWTPAKK
jgi:hypothetical protein